MRRFAAAAVLMLAAWPALGQELPKFPKARPPQPLPEATCDVDKADAGDWLLGGWVAPETRFQFSRTAKGIVWTMDRKGAGGEFGWQDGAVIDGRVATLSACSVGLVAGESPQTNGMPAKPAGESPQVDRPGDGGAAVTFEGVLTEDGKIYGYATNKAGNDVRFVLRRER